MTELERMAFERGEDTLARPLGTPSWTMGFKKEAIPMANNNAPDIITEYRDSKKKLEQLSVAARKQLQGRYLALLTEATEIQAEFKEAFGINPDLPAGVKTFTAGEGKKKAEPTPAESQGKKIGGLRRSLAAAIKNHDGARMDEVSKQLAALGIDTGLNPTPVTDPAPVVDEAAEFGV